MPSSSRITDGMSNFAGGVDSGKNPTRASQANPTGLNLNQVSWSVNCTMRGGGIGCRTGFRKLELNFNGDTALQAAFENGLFQGAFMYEPDYEYPYIVASISGRIYRISVDTDNSVDDITIPASPNPATERQAWFCQTENNLVIQDGVSVPMIWNGTILFRAAANQVPTGTCMEYYQGRLWVANGREYYGSDIIGGGAGTPPDFRDSPLFFTEHPTTGSFTIPAQCGVITALTHAAAIDTALGQGPLIVFTRTKIFAVDIPPSRADWTNPAVTSQLSQRVIQIGFGTSSERSIVPVNGDLFYRSQDGIRSLWLAVRDFSSWGNLPISRNVNRVIQSEDRSLMRFSSGIQLDNRLYETALPINTDHGVTFKSILSMDFDVISSFGDRQPPAWEGMYNGLNTLQLLSGDFGGLQRGFVMALGNSDTIELWEITNADRYDKDTARIHWVFESPGFVWGNPYQLKKLESMELWVDRLWGLVDFEVWYREDQNPCWMRWHTWQDCANRNPCEDPDITDCYVQQDYREQYRATYTLPQPPDVCETTSEQYYGSKPPRYGYQFQVMILVRGYARIRGMLLHAQLVEKAPYRDITC